MEKQIIKDYQINHLTIKELTSKYHMGQDRIRRILKENNIRILSNGEHAILRRNPGFTIEKIEQIVIDNYVNKGWGQTKSGKEFHLSDSKVKSILLKNNIPIRNLHESIIKANQIYGRTTTHYQKQENFFSIPSANMAWLIGFLAANSNIKKDSNVIRIELSSVDEEILQKIKEIVGIENPLKYREDKRGFNFVSLEWSCKQHKIDLEKYSIVPNKTFILKPPIDLTKEYYIDYIRGYFDGDGTINKNFNQQGYPSLRWGICGASAPVLQWIVDVLYEQYNISRVNLHKDSSRDKDFYSIVYSSNSTREIYKILYTNNSLFLKRKKDKFEKLLNEIPNKE